MKKQHLFIILSVVLLGFVFGVVQYYQALKTEDVSAVTVGIPNPGHSLAQLECSADSLCVDTTNNRIGIGTANPDEKLQVNGNIYARAGYLQTNIAGNNQLVLGATGANYGFISNPSPGVWSLGYGPTSTTLGTSVLSWNTSGNVGIGTTNPALKLEVKSTTDAQLKLSSPDNWVGINFADSNGSGYIWYNGASNSGTGNWAFGGGGSVANNRISVNGNMAIGSSFQSSSAPANGLIVEGAVGIGTTSPGYTLTVAGTAWVTSGSWSGSDIRWKKNISTLSQSSSLEKVMALNPVNYQWKTDEYPEMKFSNGTQLGFIAQDVEKIIPEVVTTNNEGYKGISYEKIVPVLTSAIQEQEKKIEQLKAIVCLDHPLAEVCK